jgi:hypothetical protein
LDVHASPNKFVFFCFIFWIFFDLYFAECFYLPSIFWHSAKSLPNARQKALGKDVFADEIAAECPLPSVTCGKAFAECNRGFAECPKHSAKPLIPVVITGGFETDPVPMILVITVGSDHKPTVIIRVSPLVHKLAVMTYPSLSILIQHSSEPALKGF